MFNYLVFVFCFVVFYCFIVLLSYCKQNNHGHIYIYIYIHIYIYIYNLKSNETESYFSIYFRKNKKGLVAALPCCQARALELGLGTVGGGGGATSQEPWAGGPWLQGNVATNPFLSFRDWVWPHGGTKKNKKKGSQKE